MLSAFWVSGRTVTLPGRTWNGDARLDLTDLYSLPKPGDTGKSILIMKVHPSLGQRARGSCFAVTVYAQKSKLALSEALGLEPCLAPRAPIARGRNLRDHPLKAILSAGPEAGRIHW